VLGEHPAGLPPPKKVRSAGPKKRGRWKPPQEILEAYHRVMAERPAETPIDCPMVLGVLDAFLDWAEKNKPARTFEWYKRHLQAFVKSIPPTLAVTQLRPFHVTEALGRHDGWSPSTKNGFWRAIQRAFRRAEDEELNHLGIS